MVDACFEQKELPRDGSDLRAWQNVEVNDSSPFVRRFQTSRQKYVYDVNTRRIIRVSPVVWDILEDYGCMEDGQIIAKHSKVHSTEQIASALAQIKSTREQKGLFLSFRPKQIMPPGRKKIQELLDEQREQLILDVTEDCNFRCSYCVFSGKYQHYRAHSPRTMDWEIAQPAIDEFLPHSSSSKGSVISFYGGEPLLNLPLIRQCVTHVRQNYGDLEVQFSLTTNGSLIKGETAKFLAGENFLILVSLDGSSEIHDRHRRTKGGEPTWAQVVSNIREFLEAYPEYKTNNLLRFSAVATRATDLCEARCFWGCSEIFTDDMGLEINPQKQSNGQPDVLLPDDPLAVSSRVLHEEFVQGLKDGSYGNEYGRRSKWVEGATFERPFVTFHKRGYFSPHLPEKMVFLNNCVPGARRTFVSTDGDYFACERVVQAQEQIIGNVRQGVDLEKVIALLDQWTQASQDQCRYCWCLPTCSMGCLATVGDDGKVTKEAKKRGCAMHRRSMDDLLVKYSSILEENPNAFDCTAGFEFQ